MSSRGIQFVEEEVTGLELQHINVKLLLDHPESLDLDAVIPVFHGWIQDQVCEELLLDVADYRHVHHGPGIVLIGHEADYSIDNTDGRLGLRYNRKAPLEGTNQDRLGQAARSALRAVQRLEEDERLKSKWNFNGQDLEVFVNDRALISNTPGTRQALEQEFSVFAQRIVGDSPYTLQFEGDPRRLFAMRINAEQSLPTSTLLENLTGKSQR